MLKSAIPKHPVSAAALQDVWGRPAWTLAAVFVVCAAFWALVIKAGLALVDLH